MPQIDLARATVRIKDGLKLTGTVGTGGASVGATSVPVSGITQAIPVNTMCFIGTDPTMYTVTASVGGATPTNITVTPALVTAATAAEAIVVGPNFITVVMAEGNLTYEEKRKFEYVRNKRKIAFVKTGDEDPTDVSIDALWEYLSSVTASPPTIEEALKQKGNASTWITSGADLCEPYCVDIEVEYNPPCNTTNANERIDIKEFRFESLGHNLKDGMLNAKGSAKITDTTVTRY